MGHGPSTYVPEPVHTCPAPGWSLTVDRGGPVHWDDSTLVVEAKMYFTEALAEAGVAEDFTGFAPGDTSDFGGIFGTASYSGGFPLAGQHVVGAKDHGGTTITFDTPQQALSVVISDTDNAFGGQMTITCANGATEVLEARYEGPSRAFEHNPALFATVREPGSPGDWCTSIHILPASSLDFVTIDEVQVGRCMPSEEVPPAPNANCDCESATVVSSTKRASLIFRDSVPDGVCGDPTSG